MCELSDREVFHIRRLINLWRVRHQWYRKTANDLTHREALTTGAQLAGALRLLQERFSPQELEDELQENIVLLLTPIYALFREPHPYAGLAEFETIIVQERSDS